MVTDSRKTKRELLSELRHLRERVAQLESRSDGEHPQPDDKYRLMVENSMDALAVIEADGTPRYQSPAYEQMLGYSPGERIGQSVFEIVHPDDIPRAQRDFAEIAKKPRSTLKTEVRARHKDGSWRTIEVLARNLVDHPGVKGVVTSNRDITERRSIEQTLHETECKYQALVENAKDGVVIVKDEHCVFANPSMATITGYSLSELIGMHFLQIVAPELKQADAETYRRRMAGEAPPEVHPARFQHKDGHIVEAEVSASVVDYDGGPAAMAIVRDITERRRAAEELEAHRRRLEELVEERTSGLRESNRLLEEEVRKHQLTERQLSETERRFRAMVEAMPVPIIITRRSDSLILYVNDHFCQTFGVPGEELTGHLASAFYDEGDDRARMLQEIRTSDCLLNYEFHGRVPGGSDFWLVVSTQPLEYEGEQALISGFVDVTELRQAQFTAREQEKYFRALVENSSEVFVVVNEDGSIRYESPSMESVTGYRPDERNGRSVFELVHPEDVEEVRAGFAEAFSQPDRLFSREFRGFWKNGWRHVEARGKNMLDDPTVRGFVATFRDVTEKKADAEALERSERFYRSLIENALDVMVVVNQDATISYESPSVERVLGYSLEDVLGKDGFRFVHSDDVEKGKKTLDTILANPGMTVPLEVRVRDKEGSLRIAECLARNLRDDEAVRGITINFRDITKRTLAERDLRESEERYRILAENVRDVIWTTDMELGFTYISPSIAPLLGYSVEEAIGMRIEGLMTSESLSQTLSVFAEELRTLDSDHRSLPESRTLELELVRKDGSTIWTEVVASVMRDEFFRPSGVLGIARDISERRKAREELEQSYRQEKHLREQLEGEVKRRVEFTRALTHELKTPLTSILASSDMLLAQLREDPYLGLARNIHWGASNLNVRIDELLDLARLETGMLELKTDSVDLAQLLRDTASRMYPVAESQGQTLNVVVPPSLPVVEGDAPRLQQVVLNLLDNAIKFTPKEGRISLQARETDSSIVVEVQDTGKGLPQEEVTRLFEPYYQSETGRDRKGGLGLGLALCKTLVELHGGHVWAKSQPGRGSTFAFSLPLDRRGETVPEPAVDDKLWTVLIIEDDQTIVDTISLAFQIHWPEARLLSSRLGEEGVEAVETESPDIVLLDVGLPDIDGFEVLRQIRLFSQVPVIILTVKADEPDVIRGLELGADDYIAKPFRQMELLSRIRVQLRRQSQPDDEAPISCGPLRFDPTTSEFMWGNRRISLTTIEGRIIQHLMRNAGHVVTHSRLAEAVWGEDYPGAVQGLRVNIQRLRGKVEPDAGSPTIIVTKPGIGYSLVRPT